MDLVRAVGLAGVDCAVVARPFEAPWWSRYTRARIPWQDPAAHAEELVRALAEFAAGSDEPPVLFYQDDPEMLAISRHREALSGLFRFLMPDPGLMETLADKAGFAVFAERLGLPVPRTRVVAPGDERAVSELDLRFPVIVKPVQHLATWAAARPSKAVAAADRGALTALVHELAGVVPRLVLQEHIAGPESRIESHHVYVDGSGAMAAEFTGRKIRTHPRAYGYSTAVEITDSAEVRQVGRDCVGRLGLRGVAKLDFKRDREGRLWLLEVNPRFTLWHLPGAVAGVNIPALVFADLTGRPRPSARPLRPGTTWCNIRQDFHARKADGLPVGRWAAWALRADARHALAWDDPLPFVAGVVGRRLVERATAAGRSRRRSCAR
jgi:predicted ATP-grasp superfamily ATP-dependent carboligase